MICYDPISLECLYWTQAKGHAPMPKKPGSNGVLFLQQGPVSETLERHDQRTVFMLIYPIVTVL